MPNSKQKAKDMVRGISKYDCVNIAHTDANRHDTEESQKIRYTVKRKDQVVQGKKLK